MRIRSPASRGSLSLRFSWCDVGLAVLSPLLVLYICNALILESHNLLLITSYCAVSLISSLIAFALFGIYKGIPRYFSVHDVTAVAKAVLASELMTTGVWFIVTRLDGIPRSVLIIHALTLGVGLLSARVIAFISDVNRPLVDPSSSPPQHIIVIGLNELSVLYIKYLNSCARSRHRVIGVLEDEPHYIGRTVDGVRVFGPLGQLEALIDEFHVHGVCTDRVVGWENILPEETLSELRRVCTRRNIEFLSAPDLLEVGPASAKSVPSSEGTVDSALPRYFRCKRAIDFCVAMILLVLLLPVLVFNAALVIIDVGSPIFFWQRRLGLEGRDFLLHKFRTMRPDLDWQGSPLPDEQRSSWIGRLLRNTRLDELPQLWNVLVGEMSLVGPRPLLVEDQPPIPAIRLMVRPGITGWAQVNGATLLSPLEKGQLDEWYIRNASLWLDLRIAWLTVVRLVSGHRRSEPALSRAVEAVQRDGNVFRLHRDIDAGYAAAAADPASEADDRPSVAASL